MVFIFNPIKDDDPGDPVDKHISDGSKAPGKDDAA